MMQLRPNCECCNRDLPNESTEARICTFECTFCVECAEEGLHGVCPNCDGELLQRPRRPKAALAKNPQSTVRVLRAQSCANEPDQTSEARTPLREP